MAKVLLYNEQVGFNVEWASKQSLKDFIAHEKGSGLTTEELTEAHKLCKEAAQVKEEIAPVSDIK